MNTLQTSPTRKLQRCAGGIINGILLCLLPLQAAAVSPDLLLDLSLEELMDVPVITQSKRAQPLAKTPAAVYVLTADEIRRAGVTSLADALRLVPGVSVVHSDGGVWSISTRGFNFRLSNKLLVLIDGRSVYSHIVGGVFWNELDLPLDSIERIEVIRGPGGATWGPNAMNGVINIITKNAKFTPGNYVSVAAGDGFANVTARRGDQIGRSTWSRVYAKGTYRDTFSGEFRNMQARDNLEHLRSGFRLDAEPNPRNSFHLQGNFFQDQYNGEYICYAPEDPYSQTIGYVHRVFGAHLLGSWTHQQEDDSILNISAYADFRDAGGYSNAGESTTFDLDATYNFANMKNGNLFLSFGARHIHDIFATSFNNEYLPRKQSTELYNAAIQQTVRMRDDTLEVAAGTKADYEESTGWHLSPNVRLSYTPVPSHFLWAAISRAVRPPPRATLSLINRIDASAPTTEDGLASVQSVWPNTDVDSEHVLSYEAGYRHQRHNGLWLDLAVFYSEYDDLYMIEALSTITNAYGEVYFIENRSTNINGMEGHTYGGEAAIKYQPNQNWLLSFTYSYLSMNLSLKENAVNDLDVRVREGWNPEHMATAGLSHMLTSTIEIDLWLRYMHELPFLPPQNSEEAYTTFDLQLAWTPRPDLELSLAGRNLTKPKMTEADSYARKREVFARLSWWF